ncbi:MAG: tail fiber domain-containing protein, partial [bacterium]
TNLFTTTLGLGSNYFTSLLGAGLSNITNTLTLDLTHPNAWTGLQQFNANASTTQLSANVAYFGGTATSTFTSQGWLGIGTTSPFTTLSVNGSGYFGGNLTATNLTATGTLSVLTNASIASTTLTGNTLLTNATSTNLFTTTLGLGSGNYFTSLLGAGLSNIANSLSLDLTHANIWTGLQQFNANASTTALSAGLAYFGTTATSSFNATGGLSLANFTQGSIPYIGPSGLVSQNNNGLFWDNTNSRLGIGTTSPQRLIDASASGSGTTLATPSAATIGITNTNTTNNNYADLTFLTADASGNTSIGAKISGVFTSHLANAISGDLAFITKNAGTAAEKMRLTAAGFLGLGTTTPYANLSIHANNGATNTTLFAIASSTATATTTLFSVDNTGNAFLSGNFGIGTTSPQRALWITNAGVNSQIGLEDTGAAANKHYVTIGNSRGNISFNTLTDALASTTLISIANTGAMSWGAGLGAITHLNGPVDQPFAFAATSPVQASASVAGNSMTFTAAAATAGSSSAGAGAGGGFSFTAGNASRLSTGNAAGGAFTFSGGVGIGNGQGGGFAFTGGQGGTANGGQGGNFSVTGGLAGDSGGTGGDISLTGGSYNAGQGGTRGGNITLTTGGNASQNNGSIAGGALSLITGQGSSNNNTGAAGAGGNTTITTGIGGLANGGGAGTGGAGGSLQINTGAGGNATGASGTRNGGNSGSISIFTGPAGTGASANGATGTISFGVGGTSTTTLNLTGMGIGVVSPAFKLDVAGKINTDQYSGYFLNGNLLGYASTTNGVTVFGLGAGGNNATTSATLSGNSLFGYQAGAALTTGTQDTAFGYQALQSITVGGGSTAFGYQACNSVITGTLGGITCFGRSAGNKDDGSTGNVYIGDQAGMNNTTGAENTFVGRQAGINNTTGNSNTVVGLNSLTQVTTGGNNTSIGQDAAKFIPTTSHDNTVLGQSALKQTNTASATNYNVALGSLSMTNFAGSGDGNNTAVGTWALQGNGDHTSSTFAQNTAVGMGSGLNMGSGSFNSLIGYFSGLNMTSGSYNTLLGYRTGPTLTTGSGNILIGAGGNNQVGNVDVPAAGSSNLLNIGNIIFGTNLNTGANNARGINSPQGNLGIGTTTPFAQFAIHADNGDTNTTLFAIASSTASATTTLFSVSNSGPITFNTVTYNGCTGLTTNASGVVGCTASDQRLKQNITPINGQTALDAINQLNPVSFYWKDPTLPTSGIGSTDQQLGLVAQEVQTVFPTVVTKTSATTLTPGGTFQVNYMELISPIIAALQTLSHKVDALAAAVAGFAQSITTKQVCVAKMDGTPVCITGDQLASILASVGQSMSGGSSGGSSATTTPDTEAPVLTPNGANPANLTVGDSYVDLGVSVTDNVTQNLGYSVSVDSAATTSPDQVHIDTSAPGSHTILYSAMDQAGNIGYATRNVVVQ